MRLTRVLAVASLLAVASAASLRADTKNFFNFCTAASVKACHSMTVITTWTLSGTNVTIRVRNLQGSLYGVDNTGGSLIRRIGLTAPAIVGATGLAVNAAAGAQTFGSPAPIWLLSNPGGLGGQVELTAGTPGVQGGIQGCDAPFGGSPANRFRTCDTGWVDFTFTTTNFWSANDAQVAVLTDRYAVNGGGEECDDLQATPGRIACTMVTPEPITMILLGSGLASMGGFGLIRRRKGNDVVND